jgi:hypothetical protein
MPVVQRRQDYDDSPVCNGRRSQRSIAHERLGPAGGMEWVCSSWLPWPRSVRSRRLDPAGLLCKSVCAHEP